MQTEWHIGSPVPSPEIEQTACIPGGGIWETCCFVFIPGPLGKKISSERTDPFVVVISLEGSCWENISNQDFSGFCFSFLYF